ncbi:MAG: flagellar basal body P-ring protein FlgI [Pseudomonadota bacterium]
MTNNRWQLGIGILIGAALLLTSTMAAAERVKDIANIEGVRSNQLMGYGLVVGLNGTGDQSNQAPFTMQSMRTLLERFGVRIPDDQSMQLQNVAAVSVSAELPAFAKPGQALDITVSSIGNAESLRGGTLLMTPLRGADGEVYAMGQGNMVVGGLAAEGADGSSITVNVPSVGRIPDGATVEREVPSSFGGRNSFKLNLRNPDFTTAHRMAQVINEQMGRGTAHARDAAAVEVRAPNDPDQRVSFISMIENLRVTPGEGEARVVVNSRTGTVVIGSNVRVKPAAVSHGNLTVTIEERQGVARPDPFAEGEAVVTPEAGIDVEEEDARMFVFDPGVELNSIVKAVNDVGASPSDLVAILEALKNAGSLRARLMVI